MTSISAGHIILTPTQPVRSGRPQRESNPGPSHQESRALPTELPRPQLPYISQRFSITPRSLFHTCRFLFHLNVFMGPFSSLFFIGFVLCLLLFCSDIFQLSISLCFCLRVYLCISLSLYLNFCLFSPPSLRSLFSLSLSPTLSLPHFPSSFIAKTQTNALFVQFSRNTGCVNFCKALNY